MNLDNLEQLCPCGDKLISADIYQQEKWENGELVFAVCFHNKVVIQK